MSGEHGAEFRRCLIDLDVAAAERLWAHVNPHLPQPRDRWETLVMLHRARTEARSVPLRLRAYSHRWLCDEGLPSGLPDALRPVAERMYPVIATGVGISVNFTAQGLRPAKDIIERAMADSVENSFADGVHDPQVVKARMFEAKAKTMRQLFGRFGAARP